MFVKDLQLACNSWNQAIFHVNELQTSVMQAL